MAKIIVKKCKECKAEFVKHKMGQAYCSQICQRIHEQFKRYLATKKKNK